MRICILTFDPDILQNIYNINVIGKSNLHTFSGKNDPLDILAHICVTHPTLVIADDDFLKPNSTTILKAIKKVNPDIQILFLTSSSSLDLGRQISQLGIYAYLLKPIDQTMLKDSLEHILKKKQLTNLQNS